MASLVSYDVSSSDSEHDDRPSKISNTLDISINASPVVESQEILYQVLPMDSSNKQLMYNPRHDDLYAPEIGPQNPFKTAVQKVKKNTIAGFAESAHVNDFHFEKERRNFHHLGFAHNPTENAKPDEKVERKIILDPDKDNSIEIEAGSISKGIEPVKTTEKRKTKYLKNDDASDIEGFKGPWAPRADERRNLKPSEKEQEELNNIRAKRQKRTEVHKEKLVDEKSVLHVPLAHDYQGRSFIVAPSHVEGVKLRLPDKCFLPKRLLHQWAGHNKGVACIKLFPKSGHLLMSGGMDSTCKLWRFYEDRALVRSYVGHKQAVRDCDFSHDGSQFLSTGYDRYIKLWDTETGQVRERFTCRKVAYCVKFKPESQDLFLAGTSDKKIICWDARCNQIVQEYDRHLGAVNTITFIEDDQKFVSTSDDKSLRIWEWDIPVDVKYLADPTMHSMPAVALSPNRKWLACQSMDNKIVIFSALNRFKMNRKKEFKGHMVAGYACGLDFSPDQSYLVSGDADGNMVVFDWKSTRILQKIRAHEKVCIGTLWHPMETSKVITAGWDGAIKLWD